MCLYGCHDKQSSDKSSRTTGGVSALASLRTTPDKPKHKFSVLTVTNDRNRRTVSIEFSTPLKPELELDGLVTIQNGGNYKLKKTTSGYGKNIRGVVEIRYEETGADVLQVWVSADIKDIYDRALGKEYRRDIEQVDYRPEINIQIDGTFLPSDSKLLLPFEAVNIAAVDINIVQIYADNVLTFMQEGDLDREWDIAYNGRLVYKTIYRLDENPDINLTLPNIFSLDLGKMFARENGAIYRIYLSAREEFSLAGKDVSDVSERLDKIISKEGKNHITKADNIQWDNKRWYYGPDNAECYDARSLVASDLGVIAKSADQQKWTLAVTDINSTRPVNRAKVEFFNFQLRPMGTAYTNSDGFAVATLSGQPFAAVVTKDKSVSYIKLKSGYEKSLSRFDVGGTKIDNGLKAYIYGERGVWRPGDTLHLSMFLFENGKTLPENLPASMELYTTQGQFHSSAVVRNSKKGLYCFTVPTSESDPTGVWTANFKVAGTSFSKRLAIETIKPNRLKSTLKTDKPLAADKQVKIDVEAHWLMGAPAKNMTVEAEMKLYNISKPFKDFESYCFTNPLSEYSSESLHLFSATTDSLGCVSVNKTMPAADNTPGMMNARIVTSVYEPSGSSSTTPSVMKFSPFDAYVGIKMPETDNNDYLQTDQLYEFDVVALDADGKPVANRRLKYSVWKIDWRWWWESENYTAAYYANDRHSQLISRDTVELKNGAAKVPLKIDYPNWGRYMILVEDTEGKHKTGGIVYVDWPSWRGRSDKGDPNNISMLTFSTDKSKYQVGETATIYIPACDGGRALVSIENGSRIVSKGWVTTSADIETQYRLPITPEMAPNCYVHITLLQKYESSANDLPLRMYGVQPLFVDNPASRIEPVIIAPDKVTPESRFAVKVREAKGRPMAYTLAVVDEGLLSVTGFRTPNAWSTMYACEALGIRTWDMYDDVVGAYNGVFGPILSVGGSDYAASATDKRDNRFNPVVRFLGPFYTNGSAQTHNITIPAYVGNVRVMVVAGANGAYGNAEKNITVASPLMLMSALPRIVGCNETISLPVNVFATEGKALDAEISVAVKGAAKIKGGNRQTVSFDKNTANRTVSFEMVTDSVPGDIVITVTGKGGGYKAREVTVVNARNKTIDMSPRKPRIVEQGFDFESCFNFALNYPYSCTEQISAIGITMLSSAKYLTGEQQTYIKETVPGLISQLYSRQNVDGGFGYWPSYQSDEWVTSMAGQFLTMAQAAGYEVSSPVMSKWNRYQSRRANNFSGTDDDNVQAYRLYTLALAENPNRGAMNRLKESQAMSANARHFLACAYAAVGKQTTTLEILGNENRQSEKTAGNYWRTFGSPIRDLAVATLAYSLSGDKAHTLQSASELVRQFNGSYLVTQNTAFTAYAISRIPDIQNVALAENSASGNGKVKIKGEVANHLSLDVEYKDLRGNAVKTDNLQQGAEFYAVITVKNTSPAMEIGNVALTFQPASGYDMFNERLYDSDRYDCDYFDVRDDKVSWFFDLGKSESKVFKLRLRASYRGTFTVPATYAEGMYTPEQFVATAPGTTTVR